MPTYHPAYLLRTPSAKVQVWEDLKVVLDMLGSAATAASQSAP
jgi:DNA polymerase